MKLISELDLMMRLEVFRVKKHYECEDPFYSCPLHPEYIDCGRGNTECDCGKDKNNEAVNAIIKDFCT